MDFRKYKPELQLDIREDRDDDLIDVIPYVPNIQARPSSLDTFLTCPLKSTLPSDIDEFTAYIGKILHFSHQHPKIARGMINLFMADYKNIVGENDNNLRNMLLQYVEMGEKFIEDNKDCEIYYEAPISTDLFGVRVSGHPDIIKIDPLTEDVVEVIDFKSSKTPGVYDGILDPKNGITKGQPYIYCLLACLITGRPKSIFTYYVYGKGKKPKLYKHSISFDVSDLEEIVGMIMKKYKDSTSLGIREPIESGTCYYCNIGPKKKGTCPLRVLKNKEKKSFNY